MEPQSTPLFSSSPKIIHVIQGELAYAASHGLLLSDQATTCHILAIHSTSQDTKVLGSLCHLDAPHIYTPCIKKMIQTHCIIKLANADYTSTMLSPTDVMDQVWHAHILDTAAYQSFNERFVVNGNTVHHDPLMALDPETRHEQCIQTIQAYEDFFRKPFPKDHNAWMNHDLTAFTVEYPMSDGGHSPWARITKDKVMV
jgi:hypothetical protein